MPEPGTERRPQGQFPLCVGAPTSGPSSSCVSAAARRSPLLRMALSAEVVAILLSQYATSRAKALWLVVAAVVY